MMLIDRVRIATKTILAFEAGRCIGWFLPDIWRFIS